MLNQTNFDFSHDGFWPLIKRKNWRLGWLNSIFNSSLSEDFNYNPIITRVYGSVQAGQTLLKNRYLFNGEKVFFAEEKFWSIASKNPSLLARQHSFQWLGDLASEGSTEASDLAHRLINAWLTQFGGGKSLAWAPEIVGRRLIWLLRNHWFYLANRDQDFTKKIVAMIQQHYSYLNFFLPTIKDPALRSEVIMGLIHAAFFLKRPGNEVNRQYRKLLKVIDRQFNEKGNLKSRNPQELLIYGMVLSWVIDMADENETKIPEKLEELANRIGKSLNTISHYNGKLARFHGARDTPSHLVSQTINFLTRKDNSLSGKNMVGYRKLQQGSTSLIIDVAPPPKGEITHSTISTQNTFELISNFTPLCVNVGFEERLEQTIEYQSQFINSHNAMHITGAEPIASGFSPEWNEDEIGRKNFNEMKKEKGYQIVTCQHDAFATEYGYYHQREISIDPLGRLIVGTDTLIPNEKGLYNDASYIISFNLHPDVVPEWSEHSMTLQFVLPQGEVWDFRYEGRGTMLWNEGIYLDTINSKILPTNLIQITGSTRGNRSRQRWRLEKVDMGSSEQSLIPFSRT